MLARVEDFNGDWEELHVEDIEVQDGALIIHQKEHLGDGHQEPVKLIKAPGEWKNAFTTWEH